MRAPTKYAFPTTAPTSGQTDYVILALTGKQVEDARRIVLVLRSSHDSAASGLTFEILLDGSTTYRQFFSATHLAATATDPSWTYDIAFPFGVRGLKILYDNSASTLTSWEGSVAISYDERAAG